MRNIYPYHEWLRSSSFSRRVGFILFVFFAIALPSFGAGQPPTSSGRISVVLRLDDVGANSKFDELMPVLSAMDAVEAPYTLGVIPSGLSSAPKVVTLLQHLANRGVEMGLHG